jgi:hypothetical protein
VQYDETGAEQVVLVWTGSQNDGTAHTFPLGGQSTPGTPSTIYGNSNSQSNSWIRNAAATLTQQFSIYGVSPQLTKPWPVLPFSPAISALTDVSGDGFPDIASRHDSANPRKIEIRSSQDGAKTDSFKFFNGNWTIVDHATLRDGDGNNIANDPAIVALGRQNTTGQIKVQLRNAQTGATIGTNIAFLNGTWEPVAVAVLEDANGDGNSSDRAIAVLATSYISDRILVEVRQVSNGALLLKSGFFTPAWTPLTVAAINPAGGIPQVAVLAVDPGGKNKIQQRRLSDDLKSSIFVWGPGVVAVDMAVLADADNNGTADDPAYLVVGKKPGGNNIYRARDANTGATVQEGLVIGSAWTASSVTLLDDYNGGGSPEITAYSEQGMTQGLKLRDYATGTSLADYTL